MRKPGKFGGRPAEKKKGPGRVQLGFEVTNDLKRKVEEAAEKSGRSISKEAALRLAMSFSIDETFGGANANLISTAIASAFLRGGNRKSGQEAPDAWIKDPAAFRAAMFTTIEELFRWMPSQSIDDIALEFESIKGAIFTRLLNERDGRK